MTPQQIQKLLGGYATGTLTDAEQQALFEAALHDQALFDALAREQSLRDLLRDPAARAHLLSALEPPPLRRFWTWRPIAAVVALATVATVAVVIARRPQPVAIVSQALPPDPVADAHQQPSLPPSAVGAGHPVDRSVADARSAPAVRRPAPAVLPAAPASEPPSGAVVEAPKVQAALSEAPKPEATAKAEERVQVSAADSILQPVITARTNLAVAENQAAPAPQVSMQVQAPSARQLFYGAAPRPLTIARAANTFAPQPASLALRYTILRRDSSGAVVEVDRADLTSSDSVELRFTANTAGYLTVGDATPVSLTAMEPYTTPPLAPIPAELKIIFAPQPQRQAPSAVVITEVQYRDTYVANRVPGQPLTFTIKLP